MDPTSLGLPPCAIPRPGDTVTFYQNRARLNGTLLGHRHGGQPIVTSAFGTPVDVDSFSDIRATSRESLVPPNWHRLPEQAVVCRPTGEELDEFKRLLEGRTPPGPRYMDVVEEIHGRGHEIFVVGGTVRDVLRARGGRDVDLVTTMPLALAESLLRQMYGATAVPNPLPAPASRNGHLRLGGQIGTSDPFMDYCVFKWSGAGTEQAHFSDDFVRDIANRDFACNSVYFDPINEVLIDPLGYGISDAEAGMLTIVADHELRTPFQLAQVALRFFKFAARGMSPSETTLEQLARLLPTIQGMTHVSRFRYVRSQVVTKNIGNEDAAYDEYRQSWVDYGFGREFEELIDCGRSVICGGTK